MFLAPMAVHRCDQPFIDDDYIFEPALDGIRLIYSQQAGMTRLYTRSMVNVTPIFPELNFIRFDDDIVLDGEVAAVSPITGRIDYNEIQRRLMLRNPKQIRQMANKFPVQFIIFDILYFRGRDLRALTLMQRREILNQPEFRKYHSLKT